MQRWYADNLDLLQQVYVQLHVDTDPLKHVLQSQIEIEYYSVMYFKHISFTLALYFH